MCPYTKSKRIEWKSYICMMESLAGEIKPSPKSIVAIGRGGLILGLVFSHRFCASLHLLLARSYEGEKKKKLKVSPLLNLPGESLSAPFLIVDDIVDTGNTLERVCSIFSDMGYKRGEDFFCATLFLKPWARTKPDFFCARTEEWIIFPYERV
jgi:hypothetical protein